MKAASTSTKTRDGREQAERIEDEGAPAEVVDALQACARPAQNGQVWHRRHVLDLDDFSRWEIEQVLSTAQVMKQILARPIKRVPTLRGQIVANVFYEASTRTRVSFEVAAKALGADSVSLTASASSATKGESLLDTLRTIEAIGATVVVLRHEQAGAPYAVADRIGARVINAGDGWHAHPTQGLLDLFTMRERLGRLAGLRVAIIGDILHSRVARSNLWGLTKMGAEVVVCGPPTLLPRSAGGRLAPWNARVEHRVEAALEGADVVMALRLQRERQEGGLLPSLREYVAQYGISAERLRLARPGALLMHPGPVNEGVELPPEVAHGPQSVIDQQVTNGVAVRMALLYLLSVQMPVANGQLSASDAMKVRS